MRAVRQRWPAVLLLLALAAPAGAQPRHYPGAGAVDPVGLLPAPPAEDDPESLAELEILLSVQRRRQPDELARARSEVLVTTEAFRGVLGPWFTAGNLPLLHALLRRVLDDTLPAIDRAKRHFGRPRPAAADSRIHPGVDPATSPAYPSGHSTIGMVYAQVLAVLVPDQREALLRRGREIGWDRVIGGVHHLSDVIAGRVLAQAIVQGLLADPRFCAELPAVRAEIEAVRGGREAPPGGGVP